MAEGASVRVAHVIHSLEPGGAERRLLSVAAALDRERYEPLLVCIDELGSLGQQARRLGLEPVVLGRSCRLDASGVYRLARLVHRNRVHVVHGWLPFGNLFARAAGTLARVPVCIASEGGTIVTADPRRARRYALLERALAPVTEAYIANSEAVAAALRSHGVPAGKITVIPNGVAIPPPLGRDERDRLRAALGAPRSGALVGMVARLDPDFKDHETFLAAVAALVAEGRPLHAAIIGDGPARGRLERLAEELRLGDRLTFTGYRGDASSLVRALDVSVLLTYSEGFSNVVLETMAAAVPLIATSIPPNQEAVEDGVHGLLVPVRDVEATTVALRRLLDDRELAAGLGERARKRASERYSLQAQAEATMALYDGCLAAKRG